MFCLDLLKQYCTLNMYVYNVYNNDLKDIPHSFLTSFSFICMSVSFFFFFAREQNSHLIKDLTEVYHIDIPIKILQNIKNDERHLAYHPLRTQPIYFLFIKVSNLVYRRYHLLSLNDRADAHRFCQPLSKLGVSYASFRDNIYAVTS